RRTEPGRWRRAAGRTPSWCPGAGEQFERRADQVGNAVPLVDREPAVTPSGDLEQRGSLVDPETPLVEACAVVAQVGSYERGTDLGESVHALASAYRLPPKV